HGSAASARLRALMPSKALQRTARISLSAICFRSDGICRPRVPGRRPRSRPHLRSAPPCQGKPANQILAAKHVVVAEIPCDGGERTAQPLKPQHLVGRAKQRPDAAIFVVTDPAEVIDVAELEE